MAAAPVLIWYVAYGSNLSRSRFDCYLVGGTPPGARFANPGARDPSPPRADVAVTLPGTVYFADHSASWGGAVAFYDHGAPGPTLGRAYLLEAGQFTDIMDQEMGRSPGTSPPLVPPGPGRSNRLTPDRYGTLLGCGERDGVVMLSFTAPWSLAEVVLRSPSAAYLSVLGRGLAESHGLDIAAQAAYLAGLPGAGPGWDPIRLAAELAGRSAPGHDPTG